MNQQQRKFLIDRIEKQSKEAVRALEASKPEKPSVSNYLLNAVMSGSFEIKTPEEIKEAIKKKALTSTRENWLTDTGAFSSQKGVNFKISEIFVIPDEYQKLFDEWVVKVKSIEEEIHRIKTQSDGLCTRIQLASNKTLERMINEVDDMGDISLMDTKIRQISSAGTDGKLLEM